MTENEILKHPYDELLNVKVKNYTLEPTELNKLKDQFFKDKTFQGLLGNKDYAESLVTAEWLFDSMILGLKIWGTVISIKIIFTIGGK